MEVREFEPADLENLWHPVFPRLGGTSQAQYGAVLKQAGECFTATINGEVIACVGLTKYWEGRQYVWAFVVQDLPANGLSLTRAIARWLRYHHTTGRLETAVDPADAKAIRWAEGFGFVREGMMRKYMEDGRDAWLYARVR